MFDRTMCTPENPEYCDRSTGAAGVPIRLLRQFVLLVMTLFFLGCRSGGEAVPVPEPLITGVGHYDVAFQLVQDESFDIIATVYADVSLRFSEQRWVDRALGTLGALDRQLVARWSRLDESSDPTIDRVDARLRQARAWQALAGIDEEYVEPARNATDAALESIDTLRATQPQRYAGYLLEILTMQITNPNLEEDAVRRTLDELYLIDDDDIRAATLVDAGETIADQNDPRTLNPVVQQAIAITPIVESSLLAVNLNARLAVLSVAVGRAGDVASLLEQVRGRAAEGLIVDEESVSRLEETIAALIELEERTGAGGAEDMVSTAQDILDNVSPQSARAAGYAYLAVAAAELGPRGDVNDRYIDAEERMGQIDDAARRAVVTAEYIRRRTAAFPSWNPTPAVASLLNEVSLVGYNPGTRERILSDLAASFYRTDRIDEFDRLRGLIAGVEEYNRILLRVAEMMVRSDRPDAARTAIAQMDGVPQPAFDASVAPLERIVAVYRDIGDYDRAVVLAEELSDPPLARFLATLPADFLPNPVSTAVLQRIERRR